MFQFSGNGQFFYNMDADDDEDKGKRKRRDDNDQRKKREFDPGQYSNLKLCVNIN